MEVLRITGGAPLHGAIMVSGAKNAALPIMAASILASAPVHLRRVPNLTDVDTLSLLLGHLGVVVKRQATNSIQIDTVDLRPCKAPYRLVRRMRASFCVLGPLVARRGLAIVPLPGGCQVGSRPVDLHLRGLAALGAEIEIRHGYVIARAKRLRGAAVSLAGPHGPTVTGTANVMAAATLASGPTIIRDAAREPEIVDLGNFLIALGARIEGLGESTLHIAGVEQLGGANHEIIPDRIEAATLLLAAAMTRGSLRIERLNAEHLTAVIEALIVAGATLEIAPNRIVATGPDRLRPVRIAAAPYPGLPTDVQAQFMALAAIADGTSRISDGVFPQRFLHAAELTRMGASIALGNGAATVRAIPGLSGADVAASDLRASAALVLAGLTAKGTTTIRGLVHLDRGYERLDEKLAAVGARIERASPISAPRPAPRLAS